MTPKCNITIARWHKAACIVRTRDGARGWVLRQLHVRTGHMDGKKDSLERLQRLGLRPEEQQGRELVKEIHATYSFPASRRLVPMDAGLT